MGCKSLERDRQGTHTRRMARPIDGWDTLENQLYGILPD